MACTDIKGNEVSKIVLGDDGIVYGVNDSTFTSYSIDADCCVGFGYTFDQNTATCHWSNVTSADEINVYVNPENEDGGYYIVPENGECKLDINFDYIIHYSCTKLQSCKISGNDLLNLKISYFLEEIEVTGEKTIIDTVVLFDSNTLTTSPTGLFFDGTEFSRICYKLVNGILNDFNLAGVIVAPDALNSSWVSFHKEYTDPDFIANITGKKIRFGFRIENVTCGFSIKVDNVKMLNNCLVTEMKHTSILKNPSFDIEKIVDNKKVWLDSDVTREHDLTYRETDYDVQTDRLIINSKELDLHFSSDNGIEHDLWVFIKNNPTLITNDTVDGIDITSLLDDNYLEINNLADFMDMLNSKLIDAKSRKTLSGYPTLKLIYHRYVNSFLYTGVNSNAFTYADMLGYIDILDNYWLELVEQFIPSTTIWGSTIKITNSVMDSEKFVYKKSSMIVIKNPNDLSDYIATENVSVSETIDGQTIKYTNGVGIKQISDGSEFYGRVSILQPGIVGENDDTITLTESKDSLRQYL